MQHRFASEGRDLWTFDEFCCNATDTQGERDVERWVRLLALKWQRDEDDARLFIFEDDDDESLIGVSGHCAYPEPGVRFIPVVAIALDKQGGRLGDEVLFEVWRDACQVCPGGLLWWKVERDNAVSQDMCARVGFDNSWGDSDDGIHRDYKVWLPG